MLDIRAKWRPPLWMVVAVVVLVLVALPLLGLLAAKLTSSQFVRETEESLLGQASVYAQIYAGLYRRAEKGRVRGRPLSADLRAFYSRKFHPKETRLLDTRRAILPPRPDPAPVTRKPDPVYQEIGPLLADVARAAQRTSLAGYQALDPYGTIIGGTGRLRGQFSKVPEVQAALRGEMASVIRYRSDRDRRHPLASLSRDTGYRVFVAMPVIVDDHVVGAVYLARTPNNLTKFLFQEMSTILLVAGSVLAGATLVGYLLLRLVARPIRKLRQQSLKVASGQLETLSPISHYGTREVAELGRSIMRMSDHLNNRAVGLQTYSDHVTHELKSPITAILGAVELLENDRGKMAPKDRQKFYANMRTDAQRMTRLLDELRHLAQAKTAGQAGVARVSEAIEAERRTHPDLDFTLTGPERATLPMSQKDLRIVLNHMFQNAVQHGAHRVEIVIHPNGFDLRDNGEGFSTANAEKMFDPFFTTRRDQGGTGMGLAIVKSLIEAHDGQISVLETETGAGFKIRFGSE